MPNTQHYRRRLSIRCGRSRRRAAGRGQPHEPAAASAVPFFFCFCDFLFDEIFLSTTAQDRNECSKPLTHCIVHPTPRGQALAGRTPSAWSGPEGAARPVASAWNLRPTAALLSLTLQPSSRLLPPLSAECSRDRARRRCPRQTEQGASAAVAPGARAGVGAGVLLRRRRPACIVPMPFFRCPCRLRVV